MVPFFKVESLYYSDDVAPLAAHNTIKIATSKVVYLSNHFNLTLLPCRYHFREGMLATDPYTTLATNMDYGKSVIKLYRKSFENPGTGIAAAACEGTSIMMSAINRCRDSEDRLCINSMLRSSQDFVGILSKISINEKGKAERPIFLNTIDGIHLRAVVKVY